MNGKEKNEVTTQFQRTPKKYMEDRVQYKINLYSKSAKRWRNFYWILATTAAIAAAIVPALVNLGEAARPWATFLSVAVAVMVALQAIFHPREIWRNYDLIAALLREEEMRFSTGTEPYGSLKDGQKRFSEFVRRIEDAIAKERAETIEIRTSPEGDLGRGR